ncbi:split-Soret cytochrome c [Desulfovibrio legallii]|uniref:C_GCAxxG_C_C family protein n=1 Tax=Desulfovibrio legallii TaxID=571438 RepID=A0A6H3F704_9BACT|nr:C-GCAxxG-C-C family protein [Desulfovibrio legallii]RHH23462.1 C_GCAxxG_C_C family protein [Desulfovibrio sp. AM18-2]TBH81070.1 C_GCAxxG_C_C family protein [Desulfovibrio legallii]CAI3230039.1 Split-Soret cytochrome c [Desulfovibrio diazotrophicus]
MGIGRRDLIFGLGGLAVGGAVLGLSGGASFAAGQTQQGGGRFAQAGGDHGWKAHKLDPKLCAEVAYEGYWHKGYGCGYGTFYSIVGLLGEKYGAPYNQFPFTMLEANKGGISDWGTICGALYGAAATFSLFWGRKEVRPMVNELFRWYEKASLPAYNPGDKALGFKGDLPQNVSGSVLCHISVSKWCAHNKIEATSKQRSERCGRLTADVAAKAVEIFNAKIEMGKDYKGAFPVQESVTYCGECHQTKGNEANWAKGVMDCTPCHSGTKSTADKFNNHP